MCVCVCGVCVCVSVCVRACMLGGGGSCFVGLFLLLWVVVAV